MNYSFYCQYPVFKPVTILHLKTDKSNYFLFLFKKSFLFTTVSLLYRLGSHKHKIQKKPGDRFERLITNQRFNLSLLYSLLAYIINTKFLGFLFVLLQLLLSERTLCLYYSYSSMFISALINASRGGMPKNIIKKFT